jgi:hypothetical protein
LNKVQKIGAVVILLPALSVIAISVLVELQPHSASRVSLWRRMAPFAVEWGIGLVLVAASLLLVKWLAARDREHDENR